MATQLVYHVAAYPQFTLCLTNCLVNTTNNLAPTGTEPAPAHGS
jgi:hypothetical protein